jgi:hypothetical protein
VPTGAKDNRPRIETIGLELPKIESNYNYILEILSDIGLSKCDFAAIHAYSQAMQLPLDTWTVRTLALCSQAYNSEYHSDSNKAPFVDSDKANKRIEDIFFGR